MKSWLDFEKKQMLNLLIGGCWLFHLSVALCRLLCGCGLKHLRRGVMYGIKWLPRCASLHVVVTTSVLQGPIFRLRFHSFALHLNTCLKCGGRCPRVLSV